MGGPVATRARNRSAPYYNKRHEDRGEDWREKLSTVQERNLHMLEYGINTDCTFVVGQEEEETPQEFYVHRFLLCNASAVFDRLLQTEMSEAATGQVKVTDLSPRTFHLLLRFIYADGDSMMTFQEAHDVALAADKYLMKHAYDKCVECMCKMLTAETVWKALKFVKLLPHDALRGKCLKMIQEQTMKCVRVEDFQLADEEDVALLLEQHELNVDNELTLVDAAVTWARHEAQRRGLSATDEDVRAVLEPRLLPLLRFLAIPSPQFDSGPGVANWLTAAEKWQIHNFRQTRKDSTLPESFSKNAEPRQPFSNYILNQNFLILHCKRTSTAYLRNIINKYSSHLRSTVYFRVKSSCFLVGFQVPSQILFDSTKLTKNPHLYLENVSAVVENRGSSLLSGQRSHRKICAVEFKGWVAYNTWTTIMFLKPVAASSIHWFKIEVTFKVKGEYPNAHLATRDVSNGVEFVFHTEQTSKYERSKNDGLLRTILFSLSDPHGSLDYKPIKCYSNKQLQNGEHAAN